MQKQKIIYVDIDKINVSPDQPRTDFEDMDEMYYSVKYFGIVCPIAVRKVDNGYELIDGERRLRSARMVGMRKVPCALLDFSDEDAALASLVDNIQRRHLTFFEKSLAFDRIIKKYGLNEQKLGFALGVSEDEITQYRQVAVLPKSIREKAKEHNLSKEQLMQIAMSDEPEKAVDSILGIGTNDNKIFNKPVQNSNAQVFINTINKAIDMIKKCGITTYVTKDEDDNKILYCIKLNK